MESHRPDGSPCRIQRKRTKGWRKPEGAVNVTRPSIWGNPGKTGTDYRDWLEGRLAFGSLGRDQWPRQWVRDHVHELRGKDLMCWCPPGADCHADVLLEMANVPAQRTPGAEHNEKGQTMTETNAQPKRAPGGTCAADGSAINIIFDGPPGPEAGRFVEVETDDGKSINVGTWLERDDGMWVLRIHELPNAGTQVPSDSEVS